MQITSVEIKGFKSFGEKVIINFNKGKTGIVGPNGCGKSNVIDAIRWVLGEQKAKVLRSEKMENVIFNGTKNRKSHQLAEVTLTLSNTKNILPTEYNNVSITRRYYRTGTSEYLLNDAVCRLKDITNLFLDTGISFNSYAIIELKMVDDILNDKNNSRRSLFEEAAGITKFKKRKNESLNKLEGTDADLDRVEDLLFEIKKNLKSIEKQARQAEKYKKIKKDYQQYNILFSQKKIVAQLKKKEILNDKIQNIESDKIQNITKINTVNNEIEVLKKQLLEIEQQLKVRQKTLNNSINEIRQVESDKKVKNEKLKMFSNKSEQLQIQINKDKESLKRANFSIDSLNNNLLSAENQLEENIKSCEHLNVNKNAELEECNKIEGQLEKAQIELNQVKNEKNDIDKELEIKGIQHITYENEIKNSSVDAKVKISNLQEFKGKINDYKKSIKDEKANLVKLNADEKSHVKRIKSLEIVVNNLNTELLDSSKKISSNQNQYDLIQSMVNNLEGYPGAIKFLTQKTGWGKQQVLLSDILTCQEKYRGIIENYLKPYLNYYVVNTYQDALSAVNILSDASKGKASFFNLEQFNDIKVTPLTLSYHAIPVTEIIECDEKYSKLISWLLSNVFIVNKMPKEAIGNKKIVLITEDGKLVKNKFSLNGGSNDLFQGTRIGRTKNLENIGKELKKLQKQHDKVKQNHSDKSAELVKLRQIDFRQKIEYANGTLSTLQKNYTVFNTKYEHTKEFLETQKNKKEVLNDNLQSLAIEINEKKVKQIEINDKLEKKKNENAEITEKLSKAKKRLEEASKLYNEKNILKIQHENHAKQIKSEIEYKNELLENIKQQLMKNTSEEKFTAKQIKVLLETTETNESELLEMYNSKESLSKSVEEAEKHYYEIRHTIGKNENVIKTHQEEKNVLDNQISSIKDERNTVDLKIIAVKERLSAEFGIDININNSTSQELEQLIEKESLNLPVEEIEKKIEVCINKMEKIGTINPMAQEAYQEIKERHEFVTEQKNDLLNSKNTLLETITEIESHAKESFLHTFEDIKKNFKVVFRSLFTEDDNCDIILSDEQFPLESPIEIIAKPKGKKPLTINQLSGGEKSLTAISLLFSLYLLKPAPFCIFDEVDAPLDDANVDKFNNIISDFSKDSQFIIVTHNKRTMINTDIIYGVTMVEQGVSKVVPVDFNQL